AAPLRDQRLEVRVGARGTAVRRARSGRVERGSVTGATRGDEEERAEQQRAGAKDLGHRRQGYPETGATAVGAIRPRWCVQAPGTAVPFGARPRPTFCTPLERDEGAIAT